MQSLVVLFLTLGLLAQAKHYERPDGISHEEAFNQYNLFWNRTHANDQERQQKFSNFVFAAKTIDENNQNSNGGAQFGYSKFADWSQEEFKALLGYRPVGPIVTTPTEEPLAAPGGAINWVSAGKTTAVKNQEQCGSCWAFSAVEEAESANLMAGRGVPAGSPQEIVDCDKSDAGCGGGNPRQALQWIQSNGLDAQSCYPYTARNGACASGRCSPAIHINQVIPVAGNENSIYSELSRMPLSICCDAQPWQYYKNGIMKASQCGNSIDHAIQLVGYSPNSGGYWVVRNSWGPDWGENGYINLAYGENTCGITSEVTGARA